MAVITTTKGSNYDDILTVSKKGLNYITGLKGDDKYIIDNIKKSWTIVDDTVKDYDDLQEVFEYLNFNVFPVKGNGGNDTVQINNVNANDLILFFDVGRTDFEDKDDTLHIVHKSSINSAISQAKNLMNKGKLPSSGVVEIDYHFNSENSIENVQVFKGGVTKEIDVESYIEEVTQKVKNVLKKYGYATAVDMLYNTSKKLLNELTACYKTPLDLIITDTENDDKIYAEAGADTIVFNDNSGNDTVYNATSADNLRFEDVEVSFLMKNGNNLYIYYGNENENRVCLSNYYKAKAENRLDSYTDMSGDYQISEQQITVTGKGKIVGTEGDDIVEGSMKADKIYGNGGNDKLYGDWGNDIIYSQSQAGSTVVLAGEEGNDKLYAGNGTDIFEFGEAMEKGEGKDVIYNANSADKLRFVNINLDDLKFTKSGNNLVITIANLNNLSDDAKAAYKNFQVTLSNYFKNESKLDEIEFIDINNPEEIKTASIIKDAKIHISGSRKIVGTEFNEIITGSKKSDKIMTGAGNDIVNAGKGDDVIYVEGNNCTINLDELDGVDTVYADSNSNITLNYKGTEEDIRFFKSSDNNGSDLIIARGLDFKKDMVIIKGYYDKEFIDRPVLSYQFNDSEVQIIDNKILQKLNNYCSLDYDKSGLLYAKDENGKLFSISKNMTLRAMPDDANDTYIVNNARNSVIINNSQGEDTLQINNITEDQLKMFFDVNKEKGFNDYNTNKTLYLFNSKDATLTNLQKCLASRYLSANKGVEINDYTGDGKIEHIMVADANGDGAKDINAQTKIYVIAREVQKYLQTLYEQGKNYYSASDVLIGGDSKTKKQLFNLYLKTDVDELMALGYTFDYRHNLITDGSTLTGSTNADKFLLNNSADKESRRNYSNLTFNGGKGNDEYQINTQYGSADSNSFEGSSVDNLDIVDTFGNDTYKIGANSASLRAKYGVSITDYQGDDTYELSTYLAYDGGSATAPLRTIIDDKAGDNKLSLVGDETNVGVRFSVTLNENGGYTVGNDLIIVNSTMDVLNEKYMNDKYGGCGICVKDYFENNNMSIDLNGKTLNADYLNTIAQEVAGWLSDKSLGSTTDITTSTQSDELLAFFNQSNVWQDTTSGATASQSI